MLHAVKISPVHFLAAYYWVWYSNSPSTLHAGKTNGTIQQKSTNTKKAGEVVVLSQRIPKEFEDTVTVWIAVSVVDNHGLQSQLSNVLSVRPDGNSNLVLIIGIVVLCLFILSFVVMAVMGARYRQLPSPKVDA